MANKYQDLLIEWCDALVRSQITEEESAFYGSFRCESCAIPHGRADNAVYPLVYAYSLTRDGKYLAAAERVLSFREKLTDADGAVKNDFTSDWRGITAFSAIGLLKTLLCFSSLLPPALKDRIKACATSSSRWVHENMTVGFPAYVNYYCAAALTNALYYEYAKDAAYKTRAEELLRYCLGLFTENGLLAGEGKPHDGRSPRGCLPIDIGYIAEESLPCLVHAASLLGDEEALCALTAHAVKLSDFLLPDGGWDNSFGIRNNKWTYYGSRTSDGCIGAFRLLAKRNALFGEAAERTYEILRRATKGGLLYGGMRYYENGQKPCVHHTFCHAAALADAMIAGLREEARIPLPCDDETVGYKYYPEIDTYKIRAGKYAATLTGYDYVNQHYGNGAAHASGGTLSLLYKNGTGVVIAGSVYEYKRTEPNNMQPPAGEKRHATLLVRAEIEKEGVTYATCLDGDPEITVRREEGAVTALVRAKFYAVSEREPADENLVAEFRYRFTPSGVTVTVGKLDHPARFLLPVVNGAAEVVTTSPYVKSPVFFLTGGFDAEEYSFSLAEEVTLTIV